MKRNRTPLPEIKLPKPAPERTFSKPIAGQTFEFTGLKRLLGAAGISKAGDRHAALAPVGETAREVAREILGELTLDFLWDHPLTDDRGQIDSVMRVNYDIDHEIFSTFAGKRIGELKDHLLRAPPAEVRRLGFGLTGVMAAAIAKLCDVHELVYIARKISRPTRARTLLGAPGTLASRLQPNHPTDDLRGITLLVHWGLSLGAGDALLGVNPAAGTVESTSRILRLLDELRRRYDVPTQICCLSHVRVQLACLDEGAPVEIMFQSLGGTERTNLTEFDFTVDLLDEAYDRMKERGPLAGKAEQFMYFETGQGSELSYGKHNGIDMATAEALCYGLARRYDPFMVNNVTGFIGPETHEDDREMIVANLEDHFMGKLLGVPMGMAPCYTLHARVTPEGQHIATELLTAAGANYYMDVCLGTDRMLAYFDTSAHDVQTLREIHGKTPCPEYLEWALQRGIFVRSPEGIERGPHFGDVRQFSESDSDLADLSRKVPAAYGFDIAGPRPANAISRKVLFAQATAREAIKKPLSEEILTAVAPFVFVRTTAATIDEHLSKPDAGAFLHPDDAKNVKNEGADVTLLVADGLSANAVHENIPDLLPVLFDGLAARKISVGRPIAARFGRVKLAEDVAERTKARLVLMLLGERPGAGEEASRSLSAYLVYRLDPGEDQAAAAQASGHADIAFEYSVLSNIYAGGLPPVEAASVLVEKIITILQRRAAGNRLEAMLASRPASQ